MVGYAFGPRSGHDWQKFFGAEVLDPDGWRRRDDPKQMSDIITAEEFADRWASSSCVQPASVELEILLRRIGR